jgi:hypothetical protein
LHTLWRETAQAYVVVAWKTFQRASNKWFGKKISNKDSSSNFLYYHWQTIWSLCTLILDLKQELKQAIYHFSHAPDTFLFHYFWYKFSLYTVASLDCDPLIYASHIAGITIMPSFYLLKWSLANFLPGLTLNHGSYFLSS